MDTLFKDRVLGMFAGVAIGDALGMPVETMDRKDIRALNGGKGVTGYMEQVSVRPGEEKKHLGTTTDDWQLTRAVIRGIINAKGFDLDAIAKEHVREMEKTTFGWGKGTIRSLEEIRDGKRAPGQPPLWHKEGKGCGNGVVMKISPIAAFGVIHVEQSSKNKQPITMLADDYVNALSTLTHPDPRASFAAMWINTLLFDFLLNPRGDMLIHPRAILTMDPLPEWDFESPLCICHGEGGEFVASHIMKADVKSIDGLIDSVGVGFTAWETAAFATGVYLRNQFDFSGAVLEAVNAGGDTDTNASVVGALVGATIGYSKIPEEWKSLPILREVEDLTNQFFEALSYKE